MAGRCDSLEFDCLVECAVIAVNRLTASNFGYGFYSGEYYDFKSFVGYVFRTGDSNDIRFLNIMANASDSVFSI